MIYDFKLHNIELKPGMVLITEDKKPYIVFPGYFGELSLVEYGSANWNNLPWKEVTDKVVEIRESVGDVSLFEGNLLWEIKPIEVTMDEIAEKFNVPVKYIKIKK